MTHALGEYPDRTLNAGCLFLISESGRSAQQLVSYPGSFPNFRLPTLPAISA
jgi:hypothetical protein